MTRLYGIAFFYTVILIAFTVYWGDNFVDYTHYKGDEFTFFVKVLVGMNYLLLGLTAVMYRKIKLLFLCLSPLLNAIIAFVLGLLILLVTGISGIPKHTFYVFAPLFILLSVISLYLYYHKFKTA